MLGAGLYFTIGSKFFQIRYFNYIMKQTLGKIFKKQDENGDPYGGPTYYMERGLGEEKTLNTGKYLQQYLVSEYSLLSL